MTRAGRARRAPLWTEVLETSMAALDDVALQKIVDRIDLAFALEDPDVLVGWTPYVEGSIDEICTFLLYAVAKTWEEARDLPLNHQVARWNDLWARPRMVRDQELPWGLMFEARRSVRTHLECGGWDLTEHELFLSVEVGGELRGFWFHMPGWNREERWMEYDHLPDHVVYVIQTGHVGLMPRSGWPALRVTFLSEENEDLAMSRARIYAKKFGYKVYPEVVVGKLAGRDLFSAAVEP